MDCILTITSDTVYVSKELIPSIDVPFTVNVANFGSLCELTKMADQHIAQGNSPPVFVLKCNKKVYRELQTLSNVALPLSYGHVFVDRHLWDLAVIGPASLHWSASNDVKPGKSSTQIREEAKTPEYYIILKNAKVYITRVLHSWLLPEPGGFITTHFDKTFSFSDFCEMMNDHVSDTSPHVYVIPVDGKIDKVIYESVPRPGIVMYVQYADWVAASYKLNGSLKWRTYVRSRKPKLYLMDFFKGFDEIEVDDEGVIHLAKRGETSVALLHEVMLEAFGGCEVIFSYDQEGNLTKFIEVPPEDTPVETQGLSGRWYRYYSAGMLRGGKLLVYRSHGTKWSSKGEVNSEAHAVWRVAK